MYIGDLKDHHLHYESEQPLGLFGEVLLRAGGDQRGGLLRSGTSLTELAPQGASPGSVIAHLLTSLPDFHFPLPLYNDFIHSLPPSLFYSIPNAGCKGAEELASTIMPHF